MRRWLLVVVPVLLLAGLIVWRISQRKAEAANAQQSRKARSQAPVNVDAATATVRDIVQIYDAVGSVEAPNIVNLTPQVTGKVLEITVQEGDAVTVGQVLARIDPAAVNAGVLNKQAAVAAAQQRLAEAQVTQGAQGVGIATEIRRQEAALTSSRATQAQATADREAQIATAQAAVAQAQSQIDAAKADIGTAEAAIRSAKANLANASTNKERQEFLVKEGAAAKQNLDNAATLTQVAQAAVDQAQQQRESAAAALQSATAARKAAENQVAVVRNKARADIAAAQAVVRQSAASLTASRANTATIPAFQRNINALAASVRAAEADLRIAEAQRAFTTLRSPLTGVVTKRSIDPGGVASLTQPLLTLQAIKQVWVTAGIPEEISRRVYSGQTATCTFDALPGEKFTGRITQVNPAADAQSRQFQIRVRLENANYRIKPGMFGHIRLETRRVRDVVTVPREAVKLPASERSASGDAPQTGTVTVFGADNKAETREVQTGAADAKYIAITSGVQAGDKVVILSTRAIKDGQTLRVGGNQSGGNQSGGNQSGGNQSGGNQSGGSQSGGSPAASAPAQGGQTR